MRKAGGVAFRRLLEDCWPYEKRFCVKGCDLHFWHDKLASLPDGEKRNIRFVDGHIWYGWHELFSQECIYLTMLRDPIERIWSLYYYDKLYHDRDLHTPFMSFQKYLDLGTWSMRNDQVRHLCGRDCPALVYLPVNLVISDRKLEDVGLSDLELAKENIEQHFPLFGMLDEAQLFVDRCAEFFGWPVGAVMPHVHRTPHKPKQLDRSFNDRILGMNALDAELCDWVRTKIPKKKGQHD